MSGEMNQVGPLGQGVLGLRWGCSAADVLAAYPAATQLPHGFIGVVAPAGMWGTRSAVGDIFMLTVDPGTGFKCMDFQFAPDSAHGLVDALRSSLGEGRSTAMRTVFGTFEHVHEWSTPQFGVIVSFTTRDGAPSSPAIARGTAHVQRGPLERSVVAKLMNPFQLPRDPVA